MSGSQNCSNTVEFKPKHHCVIMSEQMLADDQALLKSLIMATISNKGSIILMEVLWGAKTKKTREIQRLF